MANYKYLGTQSYVIFAEDTAWGTAGTPASGAYVDTINSITFDLKNNRTRGSGIGDNLRETYTLNGGYEITGTVEGPFSNGAFLIYPIIGSLVAGAVGSEIDPYEIKEENFIGYTGNACPSVTLEIGTIGESTDDVVALDGVVFTDWDLTSSVGEEVKYSYGFKARAVTTSTTTETISNNTKAPYNFVNGSLSIGGTAVCNVQSFDIKGANDIVMDAALGSRIPTVAVASKRKYDFTLTVIHSLDSGSFQDGLDLREFVLGASGATTFNDTGTPDKSGEVILTLETGSSTGDTGVKLHLENCYFESVSQPISVGDGKIVLTIEGYALNGNTSGSNYVPFTYYTYA